MEYPEEIKIPEIAEKSHGKWKLTVGIAAVCAVFIIAAGIIFMQIYDSEEKALIKGILNLAEEIETRRQLWEKTSGNSIDDPLGTVKMTTVFNVSSEELPVTLGVDTIWRRDLDARKMQAVTKVSMMNNKLVEVTVDGREDILTVAVPIFFQQNLSFNAAHIDKQYNDSLWAKKFGRLENGELSIELFPESADEIWYKYYVNLIEVLKNIAGTKGTNPDEAGMRRITIEKLEDSLLVCVPEKENMQYRCSQYRVWISAGMMNGKEQTEHIGIDNRNPNARDNEKNRMAATEETEEGTAAEGMAFLIAVDENDRIVQMAPEEPIMISVKYKENDIDVKIDGSICFLGEAESIDDIVVNMQMEIPLIIPQFAENLLSVFGNDPFGRMEEDMIVIKADAEILYDENDTSVTADINELTITVDRIGGFKVSGKVTAEPLSEPIKELEGETIRVFEIDEAQYEDLQKQFWQRIERWLKAAGRKLQN